MKQPHTYESVTNEPIKNPNTLYNQMGPPLPQRTYKQGNPGQGNSTQEITYASLNFSREHGLPQSELSQTGLPKANKTGNSGNSVIYASVMSVPKSSVSSGKGKGWGNEASTFKKP